MPNAGSSLAIVECDTVSVILLSTHLLVLNLSITLIFNENERDLCHVITASNRVCIYSVRQLWHTALSASLWWKPAIGRLIAQLLSHFLVPDGISWANGYNTSFQVRSSLHIALMQSDFWCISSQMWVRFGGQTAWLPAGVGTASNLEPPQSWLQEVRRQYVSHFSGKQIFIVWKL